MRIDTLGTDGRPQAAADSGERIALPSLAPPPRTDPAGSAPAAPPRRRRLTPRARRRLLWGAAAVVLALLLIYALTPAPIEVESARVGRGPLETTVNADGVTRVHDRFVVAAPITGRLERITLREGDPVESGAPVARITPMPLDPQAVLQGEARIAAAQAMVGEANALVQQTRERLAQARRSAERMRELEAAGALSLEARERAELELASAERDHQAAQARARAAASEVSAARAALLNVDPAGGSGRAVTVVRAPAAGQLLRLQDASERVVTAGTPLMEIGDPRGLEVVVDVLSTDAVRIQAGAPMRLVEWGGEGALTGRVRYVEPAGFTKISALGVEEQRVNVIGELSAPPAALGDGYRVEARIVTWEAADVLKVPVAALFRRGEEWAVFAVEEGRAQLRRVRIGHRGTAEAEVVEGLREGEQVVLYPSDRIAEGARVRVR